MNMKVVLVTHIFGRLSGVVDNVFFLSTLCVELTWIACENILFYKWIALKMWDTSCPSYGIS